MLIPRIEIVLSQIRDNARMLSEFYGKKGISLMGVSKAVLGNPLIVKAMIQGGVKFIADSRIENIQAMKEAGITTQFVLLRTALSQAESVVLNADISLNSEIKVIKRLSDYASLHNKIHQVIVMVELGDLREGVLPKDLSKFIKKILSFSSIKIVGIGCNLACYGGIIPNHKNMSFLSKLAIALEKEFQLDLAIISGGNSANYEWFKSASEVGRINNLRIGESILLGLETIHRNTINDLHTQAFQLVAEVIESKDKPSLPYGKSGQDAFGNSHVFKDRGIRRRVIIALGRQDVLISGLTSTTNLQILGSSSDHTILDSHNADLRIGSEVSFNLDYGALLSAMSSPFIQKQFIYDL